MRLGYLGKISAKDIYGEVRNNPLKYIDLFKSKTPKEEKENLIGADYFCVWDDTSNRGYVFLNYGEDTVRVYEQLPVVFDDNVFTWQEKFIKGKRRMVASTYKTGCLSFSVIYYPHSGEVQIRMSDTFIHDGSYTKNIWIRDNVSNQVIKDEINAMIGSYMSYANQVKEIA